MFGEVLSIDEVGVSDDFFDLGGHSVAAARVSARLTEAVEVVLPLESFLASPTAAGLALSLTEELTRRGMAGAGALGDVAGDAASGKVHSGGARDE